MKDLYIAGSTVSATFNHTDDSAAILELRSNTEGSIKTSPAFVNPIRSSYESYIGTDAGSADAFKYD